MNRHHHSYRRRRLEIHPQTKMIVDSNGTDFLWKIGRGAFFFFIFFYIPLSFLFQFRVRNALDDLDANWLIV